jgi:CRISPR-associated endonuclease/helicase Cas3
MRESLSFEDIFEVPPYPVQRAFIETVTAPGVYVLEAPMGIGKTEAALYAAYTKPRRQDDR